MCCCCTNLHRHQIHLISYGCVSFGLITTGLVFTVFAIFQKDSQIGKVWLAGPTTMVVGLVLCGKVIIDWGPAMLHAREGSIDSRLMDCQNTMSRVADHHPSGQVMYEHEPKCNGTPKSLRNNMDKREKDDPLNSLLSPLASRNAHRTTGNLVIDDSQSCLIYSQYDTSINPVNGVQGVNHNNSVALPRCLSNYSLFITSSPAYSNNDQQNYCDCSQYGTIQKCNFKEKLLY